MEQFKIKTYGNKKYNRLIQERCFELGYKWSGSRKEFTYPHCKYLFLWEDKELAYSNADNTFKNSEAKEITMGDLYEMELSKKFKLNSNYTAEVFPNGEIHVGCQRFTVKQLLPLVDYINNL